jgi:hypothetical protein
MTKKENMLIEDLRETFDNLDQYNIKLNLTKGAFGIPAGQLFSYYISARGIEENLEKISVVLAMQQPHDLQGV